MNGLKPCPFCGGEANSMHEHDNPKLPVIVWCECDSLQNTDYFHVDAWNTRTQSQWISDEQLKELCESYAKYCRLAAIMCEAPNYQNWLIKQGLSNPLAQPKEQGQ